MKRICSILCAACLAFSGIAVAAPAGLTAYADGEETPTSGTLGENCTWSFDNATNTLYIYGKGEMPERKTRPDGFPIDPEYCSYYGDRIQKLVLQEGITGISPAVFSSLSALNEIVFPKSLTSIGEYAFSGCTALTSVTFPEKLTNIGNNAFENCTGLAEITFPETVTSIGSESFAGTAWQDAMLKENPYLVINGILFAHSQAVIGEVTVPDIAKKISSYAFAYDWIVTEDDQIKHLGPTDVVFEEGIETIGANLFYDCSTIQSVEFPSSVKKILANEYDPIYGNGMFGFNAMSNPHHITVTIKSMDCEIADTEFTFCDWEHSDWSNLGDDIHVILRGYEGSTVQAYAEKYGFTFESLGEAPVTPPDLPVTLRGDVYCDNVVDVSDAVILARYLTGDKIIVTDQGLANADADANGKLEIDDVICIVKMIAGTV